MVARFLVAVAFLLHGAAANAADIAIDLEWLAPTENVDGTPLTDLAGYRVYWKFSPTGIYTQSEPVEDPLATNHTLNLAGLSDQAEIYVVMTALDFDQNESGFSNQVAFFFNSVDALAPQTPGPVTGTARVLACDPGQTCQIQ